MTAAAALLRGVNVGGRHKLRMEDLRRICEGLGLRQAQTLLQSGNVVFLVQEKGYSALGRRMEDAIEDEVGFRPAVMLRTAAELARIVENNPFAGMAGLDPARLAVFFLPGEPDAGTRERLRSIRTDIEQLRLSGAELFVYFPDGMGRSKLPATLDRALKPPGTARNWNTVRKLAALAEEKSAKARA